MTGILTIERQRRGLGMSQAELAIGAGISEKWYRLILRDPSRASDPVLQRLRMAVRARSQRADASPASLIVHHIYQVLLAFVCVELSLDVAFVRAADPRRGATADPAWRAAAKARQMAVYLLNTVSGVKQRHIAAAIGLTPAAVCLALQSVEDSRDDPAIDAALNRLAGLIGAEEGT